MKTKYLLVTLVILFLAFICIWLISPKVGEKVTPNEGVEIDYSDKNYELPTVLPTGFVRYNPVTEAVVYRKENADGTYSYYEYIGNEEFNFFDINKPAYLVKTSFDKKLYQIKNENGILLEEYRAFDGHTWQVMDKNFNILLEVPENYTLSKEYINLYSIALKDGLSYKIITKIGDKYAWLSPNETTDWINITVPSNFEKTETVNIYKTVDGEKTYYKKVLIFNDINKTVVVVSCDENGKFIK